MIGVVGTASNAWPCCPLPAGISVTIGRFEVGGGGEVEDGGQPSSIPTIGRPRIHVQFRFRFCERFLIGSPSYGRGSAGPVSPTKARTRGAPPTGAGIALLHPLRR